MSCDRLRLKRLISPLLELGFEKFFDSRLHVELDRQA